MIMVRISFDIDFLKKKKIYIFGAGKRGELVYNLLKESGVDTYAFVDSDSQKIGKKYCDKAIVSIDEINVSENDVFVVSPLLNQSIWNTLEKAGATFGIDAFEILEQWRLRFFKPEKLFADDYYFVHPFNHYESPYPNIIDIHNNHNRYFPKDKEVLDIDFNISHQLKLLDMMKKTPRVDWHKEKDSIHRYWYDNKWFKNGSADVLSFMMQYIKPKRIIEVGSGFSTAVMLDVNEQFFNNSIDITSIEPRPERLNELLHPGDKINIYDKELQTFDVEFFDSLMDGDILFIDSSHVSKIGSDVNYIFFEILPRINKHVYIHFHDIFYPFIYPSKWIYEGRAYNEMYILRAFLMNNTAYSIQFFGEMLNVLYSEKFSENQSFLGGSIWIRKE